jgi:hypothetical protein
MEENARMELAVINQSEADPIPAFVGTLPADLREQMTKAVRAWMLRTPSPNAVKHFTQLVYQQRCCAPFRSVLPWP